MSKFHYFFRRLLEPGLRYFSLALIALILLAALFSRPLFSYQSQDIRRINKPGHPQLELSGFGMQEKLLVKYLREEYIRDLTLKYDPYLRSELESIPAGAQDPLETSYRSYLLNQQADARFELSIIQGLPAYENYYFALYVPSLLPFMPTAVMTPSEDISSPAAWENSIRNGLADSSPYIRATAANLQEQLPIRLDSFSASGLLYSLLTNLRLLLILLPLTAFLLLFRGPDRSFRSETGSVTLHRIAAGFLYSAVVLLLMEFLIYVILSLRFGDAEGAMYVWQSFGFSESSGMVLRLREFLLILFLGDISFCLFVITLAAAFHQLTENTFVSAACAAFTLLVPFASLSSVRNSLDGSLSFLWPFQYLFWDLTLNKTQYNLTSVTFLPSVAAKPLQVILTLAIGNILLLTFLPILGRVRQVLPKKKRLQDAVSAQVSPSDQM